MNQSKKIIWITGASSGIGRGLVQKLNTTDNLLLISSRSNPELTNIKNQSKYPSLIRTFPFDLNNDEEVTDMSNKIIESYRYISQVFHCGGVSQRALANETNMLTSRKIMEVNFFSTINLTNLILPSMIKRGEGDLIIISSLAGKFGAPLRSSYAASKHALHGYYESLRHEVSKHGINIIIITPGFIDTQISKNALMGDGKKYQVQEQGISSGTPVEKCVDQILRAVVKKKKEVRVGGFETISILIKRLSPNLLSTLVARSKN